MVTDPLRMLTPAEAAAFDRGLASAFRDLEGPVGCLRAAMFGTEILRDDAMGSVDALFERHIKDALPTFAGYRVFVLTEEQNEALLHALDHVGDLVRALHAAYHAAFEAHDPRRAGGRS